MSRNCYHVHLKHLLKGKGNAPSLKTSIERLDFPEVHEYKNTQAHKFTN